jgi:hypothetical protein
MTTKTVEIPPWSAALWFFGPYSFALLVIHLLSSHVWNDTLIVLFLMVEQVVQVLYAPKINSIGGGMMCSLSLISLVLLNKGMTCGPIRSMITMELIMNGGFRYVHLISTETLRTRSFTHRIAVVTIFSDVTTAAYVDAKQAWKEGAAMLASIALAVSIAIGAYVFIPVIPQLVVPFLVLPLRSFVGAVFIYSCLTIIDGVYRGSLLCITPLGVLCESAMDKPFVAHSFQNFWSTRWDKPMQSILFHGVFKPCRKHLGFTASTSVVATFLASGVIHTLGVAACGWVSFNSCMMMMLFFVVQSMFVLLEGGLQIVPGVVATQTLCWLSSPLFVLPFLEMLQL